jgi:diphosphomevalonate decarboxylase
MPSSRTATYRVGSNIAFIKYWGVSDPALNIPLNSSISMTLADAYTVTTVTWMEPGSLASDEIVLDGSLLGPEKARRISQHLDRLRALAGVDDRARVESRNNFPMASGIASSASGFAALTVAGAAALGLDLPPERLSAIARRASGSASRSLFGGFVEWRKGADDTDSHAFPLFGPDHWDLRDVVAVVSSAEKAVSSANGHSLALTSPLVDGRTAHVEGWLATVREAIAQRDLAKLGPVIELDALAMHGIMMTSTPALLYWQPETMQILHAVHQWRADGLPVYFTIDAGPNVHLICEAQDADTVTAQLRALPGIEQIIVSRPGGGPERGAEGERLGD